MAERDELFTTVGKEGYVEFEEKRSLFIGHAIRTDSEAEALEYIKQLKKQYQDATHNVFGYMMRGDAVARYSDDGEPQGTAGMPVLEAIRKSGADDTLVVVTRYFGGILLGAGGLVRAYAHTAHLAIEEAGIVTYESYAELELACSYSDYQKYQAQLPRFGAVMDDTDFSDRVILRFAVKKHLVDDVRALVREISAGGNEVKVLGERFDYR